MNKVILIGRCTRDPDIRYAQSDEPMAIARFTLAVDRKYKRNDDQEADFINCIGFGKQGEFAEKYLRKGIKIAVEGRIQTGSYTNKDGVKVYTTDIVVEGYDFCESRQSEGSSPTHNESASSDGFMKIPDLSDDELPFT